MTTLPYDWAEEGDDSAYEPNVAEAAYPAVVPVRVVYTENENLPPGFASFMTWPIGQVGVSPPTQVLQRRQHRYKAKFMLNVPAAGTVTFNSKQEPLSKDGNPQGFSVTFAAAVTNFVLPDYDSSQPLYFIASVAGVTLAVMDESFGQVQ